MLPLVAAAPPPHNGHNPLQGRGRSKQHTPNHRHYRSSYRLPRQNQRRQPTHHLIDPVMFDTDSDSYDEDSHYDPSSQLVSYGYGPTSEMGHPDKSERERHNLIESQIDSHHKPMSSSRPYREPTNSAMRRRDINKDPYDAYMKEFYSQPSYLPTSVAPHYANTTPVTAEYDPDSRRGRPDFVVRERSSSNPDRKKNVTPQAHVASRQRTSSNPPFFVRTRNSAQGDDMIRRIMEQNQKPPPNNSANPATTAPDTQATTATSAPPPAPPIVTRTPGSPLGKPPPPSPSPVAMPQAKDGKYRHAASGSGRESPLPPPMPGEDINDDDTMSRTGTLKHGGGFMGFVKDLTRRARYHYYGRGYHRGGRLSPRSDMDYYDEYMDGPPGVPPPGMGGPMSSTYPPTGTFSRYRSRGLTGRNHHGSRRNHRHRGRHPYMAGRGWGGWGNWGYGAWGGGFTGLFTQMGEFLLDFIMRFPALWFLLEPVQSISQSRFYYLRTPLIFAEIMFVMLLVYYSLIVLEFLFSILKVMCTPAIVLTQLVFGRRD